MQVEQSAREFSRGIISELMEENKMDMQQRDLMVDAVVALRNLEESLSGPDQAEVQAMRLRLENILMAQDQKAA